MQGEGKNNKPKHGREEVDVQADEETREVQREPEACCSQSQLATAWREADLSYSKQFSSAATSYHGESKAMLSTSARCRNLQKADVSNSGRTATGQYMFLLYRDRSSKAQPGNNDGCL